VTQIPTWLNVSVGGFPIADLLAGDVAGDAQPARRREAARR